MHFKFYRAGVLCAALGLVGCASVKPPDPAPTPAPPAAEKKVLHLGLALGSGAARGFAHVGVIQVLEEAGIQPELVVGTSAGSLVAALYASGKNAGQLSCSDEGERRADKESTGATSSVHVALAKGVGCCS